jgi:toxin ParE1/3/4
MIQFSPDALLDIERVREFLEGKNPDAAKRAMQAILAALEQVQNFPDIGHKTEDAEIRQLVIRFGRAGYIVRYSLLSGEGDLLVLRVWHGREARE